MAACRDRAWLSFSGTPGQLLEAVRKWAKRAGLPYQRFIRMAREEAVRK